MIIEPTANPRYPGFVIDDIAEPAAADFELARVLAALADRHRLATVRFVARNGESWCARVMQGAGLEMSKSTFSHHLRILREAGVIAKRHEGTKSYMCLRRADLDTRFPGLIDSILNVGAAAPERESAETTNPVGVSKALSRCREKSTAADLAMPPGEFAFGR
jgi:DNA-binding transcriptional ArsR family regulator